MVSLIAGITAIKKRKTTNSLQRKKPNVTSVLSGTVWSVAVNYGNFSERSGCNEKRSQSLKQSFIYTDFTLVII